MKIKVKIKELNESSPELMVELLQYLDDLIDLGRATRTIVNTANKLSDLGVALGKNIRPEAARFVGKLEDLNPQTAINFRDAVEGARRAAEESGEAVSFMFELPNGGRITAIVNPDGLSVVRKGYRPSIAKEGERVANKRFDYDSAARASDDVAEVIADARLGSYDNPFSDVGEIGTAGFKTGRSLAEKAIEGRSGFKGWLDRSRKLSRKYKDFEFPVRMEGPDKFVFVKDADGSIHGMVWKDGDLVMKQGTRLDGMTHAKLENFIDEWKNSVGKFSIERGFRAIPREFHYLRQVYFPAGSLTSKLRWMNNLVDLAGMTWIRLYTEPLRLILRETGILRESQAVSMGKFLRISRLVLAYGSFLIYALEKTVDAWNFGMGAPDRLMLQTLRANYKRSKDQRDLAELQEYERHYIDTAKKVAKNWKHDPDKIKTADDAVKYYKEWKSGAAKVREKLGWVSWFLPEDTLATEILKRQNMFGDVDSGDYNNIGKIEDMLSREVSNVNQAFGGRTTSDSAEVDTTDDFVPTPKPSRTIPATDTIGIKGFSRALDEALSSNNIIFKPARPSARMKVKITELKNED